MQAKDKENLRSFYETELDKYGVDYRSLHWNSARSQLVRFDVLKDIGLDPGCSVLDIGCGLGDLYGYLKEKNGAFTYAGYDISTKMVETARERFPEACFIVRDILEEKCAPESFDYVVASGTFNVKISGHDSFLRDMICAMYRACKKGVGFNLLERMDYDWYSSDRFYTASLDETVAFCSTISPRSEVKTGYLTGDFTVFVYK
ncbi:MAG: class I SAM-dependent methyltransferase [Dehalococcoidia bacterium]|nr:class I SAM-dependent methyltransferase [Dehalococcoidia bacterium]